MKLKTKSYRLSETPPEETVENESEVTVAQLSEVWSPGHITYYGPGSRTILLTGEIDGDVSSSITSQLFDLAAISETEPITIHINSPGGVGTDGFAIYDIIRSIPNHVTGVVIGSCMSAALTVLSACDLRAASPNSLFFYHQAIMGGGEITSGEDIASMTRYYLAIQNRYDSIIRKRCKMPDEVWEREFAGKTSKYLSAKQALKFGLIDEVVEYAEKKAPKE